MKILIPTDYSENATNAIDFALKMFEGHKVDFVLFHSYIIPDAGATTLMAIDDVIRKDSLKKIHIEQLKFQKKFPNVKIEVVVKHTSVTDGVDAVIKEQNIDAIVMGTQGATGLSEFFLGSNAVDVIEKVKIPVFVIPSNVTFSGMSDVLFSSDYERINVSENLDFLKNFVEMQKAKLKVLHIKLDKDAPPQETHLDVSHEEAEFLKELNPEYRVVLNKDVEKGINWYLNKHPEIKMVSLINHKRGFFESLLKQNRVHNIAHHTKNPLLVINEN